MALSKKLLTVLDTDIHIHRLSIDVDVRDAICSEFLGTQPNAICSFSLVELKGNYIQKLVLLRRKTGESQSISDLIARIQNTGGRQCTLMISQLFYFLELHNTQSHNWRKTKNILLTLIDAQIDIAWEGFRINVTEILDDIDCTRATEEPEEKDGIWLGRSPKLTHLCLQELTLWLRRG